MTTEQAAHELELLRRDGKANTPAAQAFKAVLDLRASLRFYTEREAFFAAALDVSDGGQYRNDWPGALERLLAERDALKGEVTAIAELFGNPPTTRDTPLRYVVRSALADRAGMRAVTCPSEGCGHLYVKMRPRVGDTFDCPRCHRETVVTLSCRGIVGSDATPCDIFNYELASTLRETGGAYDVTVCPDPSCGTLYVAPCNAAEGTHARCPSCRLPVVLKGDHYVPAPDAAPTEAT